MVFIIAELYMLIIVVISLIILSLKKENYKSLMKMMILFYIVTMVIIYEGIINKEMSIFIYNYKFKMDYLTIVLKSIILIFMLNYTYIVKKFFDLEKMYIKEYIRILYV